MRTCIKCGGQMNDEATYCPICGAEQTELATDKRFEKELLHKEKNVFSTIGLFLGLGALVGIVICFLIAGTVGDKRSNPILIVFGIIFFLSFAVSVGGLVLSIIGATQSSKKGTGVGSAVAGIICSALAIVFFLFILSQM